MQLVEIKVEKSSKTYCISCSTMHRFVSCSHSKKNYRPHRNGLRNPMPVMNPHSKSSLGHMIPTTDIFLSLPYAPSTSSTSRHSILLEPPLPSRPSTSSWSTWPSVQIRRGRRAAVLHQYAYRLQHYFVVLNFIRRQEVCSGLPSARSSRAGFRPRSWRTSPSKIVALDLVVPASFYLKIVDIEFCVDRPTVTEVYC